MDLLTSAVWHFKRLKRGIEHDHHSDADAVTIFDHVQMGLGRWRCNFDDLIDSQKRKSNKRQRQAADMIQIISHSTGYSVTPYRVVYGCDWDAHRAMYDELIELTDSHINCRSLVDRRLLARMHRAKNESCSSSFPTRRFNSRYIVLPILSISKGISTLRPRPRISAQYPKHAYLLIREVIMGLNPVLAVDINTPNLRSHYEPPCCKISGN